MIELIYLNTRQRYQVRYIVRRTLRSNKGRRHPSPTPPAIRDAVPLMPFASIAPSNIPIGGDASSLKGGASRSHQTERLAPETGNVHRSIEITVMDRATIVADPLPDPKTDSTFWAAERMALGTGLGCVALVL